MFVLVHCPASVLPQSRERLYRQWTRGRHGTSSGGCAAFLVNINGVLASLNMKVDYCWCRFLWKILIPFHFKCSLDICLVQCLNVYLSCCFWQEQCDLLRSQLYDQAEDDNELKQIGDRLDKQEKHVSLIDHQSIVHVYHIISIQFTCIANSLSIHTSHCIKKKTIHAAWLQNISF